MFMKNAKNVYSRNFREYSLSDEQLRAVQDRLLQAFLDIKRYCEKYDIHYMMAGGSLLGTIRHKGFIPWDDDIDLMMTRDEYVRFSEMFKASLNDKYMLAEPLASEHYFYKMPKIYIRDTTFISIINAGYDYYNMLSIDVFIIERVPDSKLLQWINAKIYNLAFKGASVCFDYKYPSPIIMDKAKSNKEIKSYYYKRRFIGFLFSLCGNMKTYIRICNTIATHVKKSDFYGVPASFGYDREIFPSRVFDYIDKGSFCGHTVNIPKYYDEYLINLYGDYMSIPDEKNREIHVAYKIKL